MVTIVVRSLNERSGRGRTSILGCLYHRVSASTKPVSRPSRMIRAASSNISRESAMSSRKASNSMRAAPRPMPRSIRPSLRMSSMMVFSTTRSGSFQGRMTAPVISWSVVVLAAT